MSNSVSSTYFVRPFSSDFSTSYSTVTAKGGIEVVAKRVVERRAETFDAALVQRAVLFIERRDAGGQLFIRSCGVVKRFPGKDQGRR